MRLARILTVIGTLLVARQASAAYSGYVSGQFWLWNLNGNYCDPSTAGRTDNCAYTYYPKSDFDTWQVMRNAHIELWQGSNVIGQGSTDLSGNYTMSWSSSDISTQAYVRFFSQDKDNRFYINDTNGLRMNYGSGTFTLTNGTTIGQPQNIGSLGGGSHANPGWWVNVYWAEELEYRTTFALVNTFVTNWTGIEIRGLANNQAGFLGNCPTSCAVGSSKRIQLDANAGFSPQGRILHESGHVADYIEKNYHGTSAQGSYCWPNTAAPDGVGGGTPCGWSLGADAEWGSAAFEEGLATFSADNTLWPPGQLQPTSCLSSVDCPINGSTNIEQTDYPYATNNCSTVAANPESRWALTVMRYLWDLYDNNNDADGETISTGNGAFSDMYDTLGDYPTGVGYEAIDDPWSDTTYTTVTNFDGRGAISYAQHFYNRNTTTYSNAFLVKTDNCSPN
jgi:hypothetical protein